MTVMTLSAGWQSDFVLFTTNPNSDDEVNVVHPRELEEKSESEADAIIVENMAARSILLPPNLPNFPPGLTTDNNHVPHHICP
jgi:hypothetical protein